MRNITLTELADLAGKKITVIVATHKGYPLRGEIHSFSGGLIRIGPWEIRSSEIKKCIIHTGKEDEDGSGSKKG